MAARKPLVSRTLTYKVRMSPFSEQEVREGLVYHKPIKEVERLTKSKNKKRIARLGKVQKVIDQHVKSEDHTVRERYSFEIVGGRAVQFRVVEISHNSMWEVVS